MKDFWKKHRKKLLVGAALLGFAVFVLALYLLGFRITYDPAIITDWDAVSAGISLLGVLVSGVAIYYAVQVPKKIADRQDRIALFEKRFEVYSELRSMRAFAKLILETLEHLKMKYHPLDIQMLVSMAYGIDFRSDQEYMAFFRSILPIFHEISLLFPEISNRDARKIGDAFVELYGLGCALQEKEKFAEIDRNCRVLEEIISKYDTLFKEYLSILEND